MRQGGWPHCAGRAAPPFRLSGHHFLRRKKTPPLGKGSVEEGGRSSLSAVFAGRDLQGA